MESLKARQEGSLGITQSHPLILPTKRQRPREGSCHQVCACWWHSPMAPDSRVSAFYPLTHWPSGFLEHLWPLTPRAPRHASLHP